MMQELTQEALRRSFEAALASHNDATNELSQDDFSGSYPSNPDWAIGPFTRDDSLTFAPDSTWEDPTAIGWTTESIFNPSVIERDGALHLFYRASPRKESIASRIGVAKYTEHTGWVDSPRNPVVFPTIDNEIHGCEDPKVYGAEGKYFLFYNGIFPVSETDRDAHPSPDYPVENVGCDINVAVSYDLENWTKLGAILTHDVSRLWAKGAVIPRNAAGEAVKIDGEYLMYLSEGCNGVPHVGRSRDMLHWHFTPQPYLDMSAIGGHLHEVACAIVNGDDLVIDFFYSDESGKFAAAQALYRQADPFTQIDVHLGGSLSWGGLLKSDGSWLFAQGWDAPPAKREIYFYRSSPKDGEPTIESGQTRSGSQNS